MFATDDLNLYGSRFTPAALVSSLLDIADTGIPSFMSHDASRPIGWSFPIGVYFEPGRTKTVGQTLVPQTDEDKGYLHSLAQARAKQLADEHEAEISELRERLAAHLNGGERLILRDCVALTEPGLARRAVPEAFTEPDHDGLFDLRSLPAIGPGAYQFGDLVIFAHSFLRRSLLRLNSLNTPFLRDLHMLAKRDAPVKIAIDPDMVALATTWRAYEELEYWWGPKFDDDLTKIPPGVSRHEASDSERLLYGISRTEFWWQSRDNQHIFETEELRNLPNTALGTDQYGCRYVHTIVNEITGQIDHFDGAVRVYNESRMVERMDTNIAYLLNRAGQERRGALGSVREGDRRVREDRGMRAVGGWQRGRVDVS